MGGGGGLLWKEENYLVAQEWGITSRRVLFDSFPAYRLIVKGYSSVIEYLSCIQKIPCSIPGNSRLAGKTPVTSSQKRIL